MSLILLTGCSQGPTDTIHPQIKSPKSAMATHRLPSPFRILSEIERSEDWGREYYIGQKLARSGDYYRAIGTFKRAEILIPEYQAERLTEIHYFIVLSYYLGQKYHEAITAFEQSSLVDIDKNFPAYKDLLVLLMDAFLKIDMPAKADLILKLIEQHDKHLSQRLALSCALVRYDKPQLDALQPNSLVGQETHAVLSRYDLNKKSPAKAQLYNALLPGMGYLYCGQKQSALTALLLNGLTTYAAFYFFKNHNIPAGVLFSSVEMGWYVGGIVGAKEMATLYNERIYEQGVSTVMQKHDLHPVFQLSHSF